MIKFVAILFVGALFLGLLLAATAFTFLSLAQTLIDLPERFWGWLRDRKERVVE